MTRPVVWRERGQSIEIPVRRSNEVVEVFLDELPTDAASIEAILHEEHAPLPLYLHFALEYYYQGNFGAFRFLLRQGLTEARKRRADDVPLLTALAAFNVALALSVIAEGDEGEHGGKGDGDGDDKGGRQQHQQQQPQRRRRAEDDYFAEAAMQLNDAERTSTSDVGLLLRKGLLLMAQRKFPQADYQLKAIAAREPDNVAVHVALGCLAFLTGDYAASLGAFQLVLRRIPSSPEDVRMAIGQCQLRLGNEEAARAAFERVLAVNGNSVPALVSLAVVHLNGAAGGKHAQLAQGLQLLKRAYDLDRLNPTVLYHLANHFFFKQDYGKALQLAQSALANAAPGDDVRRAMATYMLGKIQHAQGRYEEAFLYYSEAAKLHPNLVLAQLGLGQVCLQRGDVTSAADCFERVVALQEQQAQQVQQQERNAHHSNQQPHAQHAQHPQSTHSAINDAEFWAMMGTTYSVARASHAEGPLRRAAEMGGRSFDLSVCLAALYGLRDAGEALAAYRAALALDGARFEGDAGLLNNYAVTLHMAGARDEAYAVLGRAARLPLTPELLALCRFNEARLLEDMGRLDEAEGLYRELVAAQPNDVALHLRLGLICARRGQHADAAEHYKEAIGLEDANADAWVLLASNHLRVKALTPARKAFERILKTGDRHDLFALTALGNIYVEAARQDRRAFRENVRRALEFYIKALQVQPQNHVAANGVGVVLAELGRHQEAKEIFLQVRQAAPDYGEATLNLAHCFVELGQCGAAIHAYEALLAGASGRRVGELLLFLARATYIQAKAERSADLFDAAVAYLERVLAELQKGDKPNTAPVRFNVALCREEGAAVILKQNRSAAMVTPTATVPLTREEADRAASHLEAASACFRELLAASPPPDAVDLKIVEQRLQYCDSLRRMLEARLESTQDVASSREARLDAVRVQREEQQRAEQERLLLEAEARRLEQERSEEIRRELAAKLRVTEERVRAAAAAADDEEEVQRPAKKRRSRRSTVISKGDGLEEEEEDEDEAPIRGRQSHLSRDFIEASDLEDDAE